MALDILILSVLRAGPVHGYELKRRVQRPSLTPLSNNSLYPTLRRFEAADIVTQVVEEQEGKPARKVYTITDAGRHKLTELISVLPPELAANEEEFLMRLSFFDEIDVEHRLGILSARTVVLERARSQVRELFTGSEKSARRQWRNLAMSQLLTRLDEELEWIAELAKKAEKQ